MLLGAVVDVALQPASFGVLGLDEPLARGLELVGAGRQLAVTVLQVGPQPDQPQHQSGLGGQTGEQPLLDGGERQPGPFLEPEHPQHLVAVPDRQGSRPPSVATAVGRRGRRRSGPSSASAGQRAGQRQAVGHLEPDLRPLRARSPARAARDMRAGSSVGAVTRR